MNRRPRSGGRKMGSDSALSQEAGMDLGSLFNVAIQTLAPN